MLAEGLDHLQSVHRELRHQSHVKTVHRRLVFVVQKVQVRSVAGDTGTPELVALVFLIQLENSFW